MRTDIARCATSWPGERLIQPGKFPVTAVDGEWFWDEGHARRDE